MTLGAVALKSIRIVIFPHVERARYLFPTIGSLFLQPARPPIRTKKPIGSRINNHSAFVLIVVSKQRQHDVFG